MDEIYQGQHVTVSLIKRLKQANYIINPDATKELIDKPVLLCLGGNKIILPKDAGVVAKIVNDLVGKIEEPYDIISVAYGEDYMSNRDINAKYLCDKLLLPLVSDNGERLPFGKAMKNMRRVNVFTHCAGNFRFDAVLRELKIKMHKLGYLKQEAEAILGQICVVGYTPWSMIRDDHVKKLYFQSIEDMISPKLAETLFNWQKQTFPKLKVEVSNADMLVGDRDISRTFCDRIYRLALENKIISFGMKKNNVLCYLSCAQSKDYTNNDHELRCLIRDSKFGLKTTSSEAADVVSLCLSEVLLANLSNSLSNEYRQTGYEDANSITMVKGICDSLINLRLNKDMIK